MHKNTTQLRKLMKDHQLTDADVARITRRQATTVSIWRCRSKRPDARVIPTELLQLVRLTAKQQQPGRA